MLKGMDWWEHVLVELTAIGYGAVVVRMAISGLFRRYRFFALFVCASLLANLRLLPLDPETDAYTTNYIIWESAIWILSFFVVSELFALILKDYPALAALGRWLIKIVLPAATILCLATAIPGLASPAHKFPQLSFIFVTQRTVVLIISSFLLVIIVMLINYPIAINKNLVLYCGGFGMLFVIGIGAPLMAQWAQFSATSSINIVGSAVESTVLFSWAVLLSKGGEQNETAPLRALSAAEGARLIAQLKRFNAEASRLLGGMRKSNTRLTGAGGEEVNSRGDDQRHGERRDDSANYGDG